MINEMDRIAEGIKEEVIIQAGHTDFKAKNAKYFTFISKHEFDNFYADARVIVSHAGVGTIIKAIRYNKPIIVVPRRKEYGEHFDDHQIELAKQLEKDRKIKVKVVWDIKELEKALTDKIGSPVGSGKNTELIETLKEYISIMSH